MDRVYIKDQPSFAKNLVVGVQWTTESGKEFKATRTKLKTEGWDWLELSGNKSDSQEMTNYGVVLKENLLKQGETASLAAWLANCFREGTVVAVEAVDLVGTEDSCIWYCIINDGQVVTGSDVLCTDTKTANAAIQETLEALGVDDPGFIGLQASELGDWNTESETTSLSEVLTKTGFKRACFKSAGSGNGSAYAVLVVGALALVVGCGWWYATNHMAESDAAYQAEQARKSQLRRAEREYRQILQEVGGKHQAGLTMQAMWDQVFRNTQTQVGGWELESIDCVAGSCTASYTNTDLTLPKHLKAALADQCDDLNIGSDGTTADCLSGYEGVSLIADEVKTDQQLNGALLTETEVERLRADFMTVAKLGSGTGYALNDAIQYPFRGSRYLPNVEMFTQGEWILNLPVKLFVPVAIALSSYRGMAVQEISLTWGSNLVELRGLYFSTDNHQ